MPPCLAVGLTLRPLVVLYQRRSSSKATLPSSFSAYQERQGCMASLDGTSVSSSRETCTNVTHSRPYSLAVGFLLSILGSIVLFVGQLGLFAGTCSSNITLLLNLEHWTVLYVLGTIVSLIGTGFLIGVSLKCFAEISWRNNHDTFSFWNNWNLWEPWSSCQFILSLTFDVDVQTCSRRRVYSLPGINRSRLRRSFCAEKRSTSVKVNQWTTFADFLYHL